ncbi:membrane protein [Streptomyces sp. AS58]|uniref:FtsX-like permease family protein n=1 Tax=Streptomyces sp. AS58 TaxID=1519489 RepID=UPI0006AF6185|nr:FtsX-like permease family protein [Streptomyces sp. AS58]KOV51890.1 membrane protein [Streptomyces sp. AS58]
MPRQTRTAPPGRIAAPWIRTRLRAAPGAAWALALLVAATACLAAAFPRALDRYADAGLREAVERARPDRTTVQLYTPLPGLGLPRGQRERTVRPDTLAEQYTHVLDAVRAPLVADRDQSSYGVRTTVNQEVPERWLARPSGLPARVALVAQHGIADHSRLRAGRLPRGSSPPVTTNTAEVEAAVTAETAKNLRIKVDSVVHVPGVGRPPLAVRITGIVTPREPGGAYWSAEPLLRTPTLVRVPGDPDGSRYWLGALLLAPEAAPALLGTTGAPATYWQVAPALDTLRGHDLAALKSSVASLETGPGLRDVRTFTDQRTEATTYLDDVLTSYDEQRAGIGPLVAVAAFGTGTVAVVVLVMAGGLAADRRRGELALLRARGASVPGLVARLLGETSVVSVPAAAAGVAAALLLVPEGRLAPALAAALAVTGVACLALPLRAAGGHRLVRVHGDREDAASVRPSRRRTVAELTLVVLAAGAVETLRRRGTTGDQLVSAAPVLVAVIAALVLIRLYPLPLRGLARPAARLRGAVGPLSLARAARTSVSAVLPLLALSTALTTAAFGGSVLAGVREARDHAALLALGADARVETMGPLPSALPERIRREPGVSALAEASIAYQAKPHDGPPTVPLVGVDPGDYAALARWTGLGTFTADELTRRGTAKSPLPALASPTVAETYGTRPFPVRLEDSSTITVRITLVRDLTPAVSGTEFLVVDRAGLSAEAARPSALLVTGGHLDGKALRRAAGEAADVRLRAEERARFVDSPMQTGAERLYVAAVAAGAGYAVLALLLSLLRAAPERTALLARLRTMGLTRAQGRRLLVLESLPQSALAAAGGTLTAWATIRLLSPGVDLTAIAASRPVTAELRTDPVSLAVPAVSVLLLTVGVAAAQAWWSGRRGSVTELRAGDGR